MAAQEQATYDEVNTRFRDRSLTLCGNEFIAVVSSSESEHLKMALLGYAFRCLVDWWSRGVRPGRCASRPQVHAL